MMRVASLFRALALMGDSVILRDFGALAISPDPGARYLRPASRKT
jgi:hypothetical protein